MIYWSLFQSIMSQDFARTGDKGSKALRRRCTEVQKPLGSKVLWGKSTEAQMH